ncbi:MAG: ATP-binding protein [Desulforhopalus sp.]|nr:ATP-binding protein [Desulforhopalus sp.]
MSLDPLILNLQHDLLVNILPFSEDINKFAAQFTTQLREIIGARVIALFERQRQGEFHLVGVCPSRKRIFFEQDECRQLIAIAASMEQPFFIQSREGEAGALLEKIGIQTSFAIPLVTGGETQGLLLLLDLMDPRGTDQIFATVRELSGLLALILKNAFLFRNMEYLVAERTRELVASEARAQSILRAAMDGFLMVGGTGEIIDANDAYCRMSGYPRQQLLKMNITELNHDTSSEEVSGHILQIQTGNNIRFETTHRRNDGSLLPLEVSVQVSPEKDNERFAFLRDLSLQKKSEQQQHLLQDQLLQAQKMESVGRLAGGVAHDFNNMLGVILGYAEFILEGTDNSDPRYGPIIEITKAARRSADLTRQLLAFARKQTVMPKVLDLNETVGGMLNMLKRLLGENIRLNWLPGRNLHRVRLDPSQIDQILANLCVNARDAIKGTGYITIETTNQTIDETYCSGHLEAVPGNYVVLAVSDNGCGMPPEVKDRIFEPFFTTKGVGEGTGLGLATVYGIVKQNSGFITVYSEPGHGSTFRLIFPAHRDQQEVTERSEAGAIVGGKETVLLVEDEKAIREMTATMLSRLGYKVLSAATPSEAMQHALDYQEDIHLLLTDVIMPEMNGRELARQILKLHPKLVCMFMSGYTADIIAHHGVLAPGVNFLQKPFSKTELNTGIRQALQGQGHAE